MGCGAGFSGTIVVHAIKVGYILVALIEMEIEISAAVSAYKETGKDVFRALAYFVLWESAASDGEKELLRRARELENRFSGCEIVAELCGQGPIIRLLNLFANPSYAHLEDEDVEAAIPFITERGKFER